MYDSIARFYDIIHAPLTADLEYALEVARASGGPILELGCGTGRLLFPLARAGHEVTGVDNASAMLARARKRLDQESPDVRQRVHLVQADVKNMSLPQAESSFSLILLPYNTLLHFRTDEIRELFRNISKYLHHEGRLLIDVINPFIIDETTFDPEQNLENIYFDQETGETIRQMSLSRLDSSAQRLHISWIFEVEIDTEPDQTRTTIDFNYWYQYPHQLDLLLQQSGFCLVDMLGDYDGSPFNETSARLLITARQVPA